MSENGITRRRFLGGAAVIAAATAVPAISSVAPAMATPDLTFPLATPDWTPLDPTAAARQALEIYRGKHPGQGG